MTEKPPKIFISYSWKTSEVAKSIYGHLTIVGIEVLKDSHEIKYADKISHFMDKIRDCDYSLLLVSDHYLKSKNCMYEVLQLLKEKNVWDKVLPVIVLGTNIYRTENRIEYVDFWQKETQVLEKALKNIDPINAIEIQKDIKIYRAIAASIDEFIKTIADIKHSSPDDLIKENYNPIIEKIGFFEHTKLSELLAIVITPEFEKKEIMLDTYLAKNGPSSFYYTLKGGFYRQQKKFDLAKHYYIKANELNEFNVEAQNNLGQIYQYVDKDYFKAKECYEKAIKTEPNFDIPRLNLGVLFSDHLGDEEGAREQYEEILKFDPTNAKAHNNLGGYYKKPGEENLKKSEFHTLKAIEIDPNYIEAYLNYGSLLKVYLGQKDKGHSYYVKAKELDKEGRFKEIIDLLIKKK